MRIRPATLADVNALVLLGAQFLASSPYGASFAENLEQMDALATHLITVDDGIILVAEDDAVGIVGMLALLCHTHPWSGERVCGELAFFVDPDARGSTGVRLLKAAERWALEQGATQMHLVAPTGADRVGELYARLGFEAIEIGWRRDVRRAS